MRDESLLARHLGANGSRQSPLAQARSAQPAILPANFAAGRLRILSVTRQKQLTHRRREPIVVAFRPLSVCMDCALD